MIKFLAAFMAIYVGLALFGGIWDGLILSADDHTSLTGIAQAQVVSHPASDLTLNPFSWLSVITAGANYIESWADILLLRFSFFPEGSPANLIRWGLMSLLAIPLVAEFITRLLGR